MSEEKLPGTLGSAGQSGVVSTQNSARISERYLRQLAAPEVGREGQLKLGASSVLCIGVGGLGSPLLLYIAAAGVGRLGVMDDDRVDLSNLQRQVLFTTADLGKNKATAAAERLRALNPEIQIEVFESRFNAAQARELVPRFDVIVNGSDNFATQFLCNDSCVKFGKPLVFGSVLQWEGRVSVFDARRGPCYRCLYPEVPVAAIPSCAEAGVLGSIVGQVGTAQASEVLKLLLSDSTQSRSGLSILIGRLAVLDGWSGTWSSFEISKNPACPVCSLSTDAIPLEDLGARRGEKSGECFLQSVRELSAQELREMLSQSPSAMNQKIQKIRLIDLREEEELEREAPIPGSEHWAYSRILRGEFPSLPPASDGQSEEIEVVLYCHLGIRSKAALLFLREQGFGRLAHLKGGIVTWK